MASPARRLLLCVGPAHVAAGEAGSACRCPVARALSGLLTPVPGLEVRATFATLGLFDPAAIRWAWSIDTPDAPRSWMECYDAASPRQAARLPLPPAVWIGVPAEYLSAEGGAA